MTALWIVGILLAIFLVVQLSRVGVRLAFGAECRVMLRLGPIRMPAVPKKETATKKPKKHKATKTKQQKPKKERMLCEEKVTPLFQFLRPESC